MTALHRFLIWLGVRPPDPEPGISLALAEVLSDLLFEESGHRFSAELMAPHVVETEDGLEVVWPGRTDGLDLPGITIAELEGALAFRERVAHIEMSGVPRRVAEIQARQEMVS